jgi:hypothetical protein
MGVSTDAILAYGVELYDPDTTELPGWYDEDENEDGFVDAALDRLRAAVGFTETDYTAEGFWTRQREADERVGVSIVAHCSGEYTMYLLAAKEITASRGYPVRPDMTVPDGADERIRWALEQLGMDTGQTPAWLLVSWWG